MPDLVILAPELRKLSSLSQANFSAQDVKVTSRGNVLGKKFVEVKRRDHSKDNSEAAELKSHRLHDPAPKMQPMTPESTFSPKEVRKVKLPEPNYDIERQRQLLEKGKLQEKVEPTETIATPPDYVTKSGFPEVVPVLKPGRRLSEAKMRDLTGGQAMSIIGHGPGTGCKVSKPKPAPKPTLQPKPEPDVKPETRKAVVKSGKSSPLKTMPKSASSHAVSSSETDSNRIEPIWTQKGKILVTLPQKPEQNVKKMLVDEEKSELVKKRAPVKRDTDRIGSDVPSFGGFGGGGGFSGGGGGTSGAPIIMGGTGSSNMLNANLENATSSQGSSGGEGSAPILIKGGSVVNEDAIQDLDILLEDGIISQIGLNLLVPEGCKTIDATGKYVMPGGIDPHTHFESHFFGTIVIDDFSIGTQAAIAGGTTMIIDFAKTARGDSPLSVFDKYRSIADPKVHCDYGISMIMTETNERVKREMSELVKNKGVNSFKYFLAYADLQISDRDFYDALIYCKKIGALPRVHAENGDLIQVKQREILAMGITGPEGHLYSHPEECEEEATHRACMLAKQANCPLYVVHVMTQSASNAIGNARRQGATIFGESVASALGSVDGGRVFDPCWAHAAAHVMSPPLSTDRLNGDRLLEALACGQLQLTGSDHATFDSAQKAAGRSDFTKIPNGVNGVQERMAVIWHKGVNAGKFDPMRFVAVTSSTAAKLFNIYPKKGRIATGSDADIVIWDPELVYKISSKTHLSKCDFNVFEGIECLGSPTITICRGVVVYENGKILASPGSGRFVALPPFSPFAFDACRRREKSLQLVKVERAANGVAAPRPQPLPTSTASVSKRSSAATTPASPATTTASLSSPSTTGFTGLALDDMPVGGGAVRAATAGSGEFHARATTRAGNRNLQDSSFSFTGAQVDDDQSSRRGTKISKPPGGESHGLW